MKSDFSEAHEKHGACSSGTGFQPVLHGPDLPARGAQAGAHATRGLQAPP